MSVAEFSSDPRAGVEALYRAYHQDVYRSLLRHLGSPTDADDGTQLVFLSAFRALDRGCRPRAARAWLLAIAKNVAHRTWREQRRVEPGYEGDTVAAKEPADESRRELVAALETLPEGQRTALVLHELYGLQYSEISELTQQSVAGVETSVFRGRQAVRTAMLGGGALGHEASAKLLKRFVAGKLTRNERLAVQAHLRACDECATAEARLRRTPPLTRAAQWVLAVPSAIKQLLGLLQGASVHGAGAAAVCAVALGAAAGDGSTDRGPATPGTHVPAAARTADLPAHISSGTAVAKPRPAAAPSKPTDARQPRDARPSAAPLAPFSRADAPTGARSDGSVTGVGSAPDDPGAPTGSAGAPAPGAPAPPAQTSAADAPAAAAKDAGPVVGGLVGQVGDSVGGLARNAGAAVNTTANTAAETVVDPAADTVEVVAGPPASDDPVDDVAADPPPPLPDLLPG